MTDSSAAGWDNALNLLQRWHDDRNHAAARAVFGFMESELRLMTPALVRRTWPEDLVEDALRDVLARIFERRLPPEIGDLRAYLLRAFRNRCIDHYRARKRRREAPFESAAGEWECPDDGAATPLDGIIRHRERTRIQTALARLSIADRVALKLEHAPEWLSDDEVGWIADGLGASISEVRQIIEDAAGDMHALTRVFDPGDDDATDPDVRRLRMERFRRRRARAREKLRVQLDEVSE